MKGWNYTAGSIVRAPKSSNGKWKFPEAQPMEGNGSATQESEMSAFTAHNRGTEDRRSILLAGTMLAAASTLGATAPILHLQAQQRQPPALVPSP